MALGLSRLRGRTSAGLPRVVVGACVALAGGAILGLLTDPENLSHAAGYQYAAGLLLAIGLYGSTHDIDFAEVRRSLKVVLVAVTVGVLVKASLIATVMVLAFDRPEYLVLGIAVAQIDPLSVAATQKSDRVSPRAKAILSVWAAFDDPMTVLLTLYFSALAVRYGAGPAGDGSVVTDTATVFGDLLLNLGLFVLVAALWWAAAAWLGRGRRHGTRRPAADVVALALVVALILFAAQDMMVLAVALTGLLVRLGRFGAGLDTAVALAFLAASAVLGVVLASGEVFLREGLVLGVSAFAAQLLVTLLISRLVRPRLTWPDLAHLGFGQQNGITAILLALALEPRFPGTVGVVGPAIVTVNLLHHTFQWARVDRWRQDLSTAPEPQQAPAAMSQEWKPEPG
ncbi:NhaP-type Na+/H+ or K+/H+ antiporter [Streptomyces luteogriseus]|uniref:NhaP-type Na+/H+ or K+/H+ antiporter n=1 Tax=Streptomyces luteogriseus TaxID=68233 RepID=A0A7W7DKE4_9ACTN|nr:NhaP-type Na+/H+ or K+/H+ antiporter [Streptomyces luteogriseus]